MVAQENITELYDFKCEVIQYEKEIPEIVTYVLYRSEHREFYKGTKTTKCEFTIVSFGGKYSCFVYAIDDNKKNDEKIEFRGNLLWGFGESLELNKLKNKLSGYTNLDQVKKDFGI